MTDSGLMAEAAKIVVQLLDSDESKRNNATEQSWRNFAQATICAALTAVQERIAELTKHRDEACAVGDVSYARAEALQSRLSAARKVIEQCGAAFLLGTEKGPTDFETLAREFSRRQSAAARWLEQEGKP